MKCERIPPRSLDGIWARTPPRPCHHLYHLSTGYPSIGGKFGETLCTLPCHAKQHEVSNEYFLCLVGFRRFGLCSVLDILLLQKVTYSNTATAAPRSTHAQLYFYAHRLTRWQVDGFTTAAPGGILLLIESVLWSKFSTLPSSVSGHVWAVAIAPSPAC